LLFFGGMNVVCVRVYLNIHIYTEKKCCVCVCVCMGLCYVYSDHHNIQ
jgi:hypothetical protein